MTTVPAVEFKRLTKRYDTVTALDDVSFSVPPGQIMGVLGPNGAGKTTALRILTGLLDPTAGTAAIDGLDVTEHPLETRRRLGYLPEQVSLYPELRVQEYLHYRAAIKRVARRERRARVNEALEQCALADMRRRLIGRLSKGYRQRAALADCLLGRPKVLILDEPTVGLDPHQIRQTRDLIQSLGRSATILLCTHILPEVEMLCQQVVIINRGRIVAADSPGNLRRRLHGGQAVRVEVNAADPHEVQTALSKVPGIARADARRHADGWTVCVLELQGGADPREAVCAAVRERGWPLRELASQRASLEDVFVQLTTQES